MVSESELYRKLIKSPARVSILYYLAEHGPSRFLELKKGTGLSTGAIYHHLKSLEEFVVQDENKSYRLNEKGLRLVALLKQEGGAPNTQFASVNDALLETSPTLLKAISFVSFTWLFRMLASSVALSVAVLIAGFEFCVLINEKFSQSFLFLGSFADPVTNAFIALISLDAFSTLFSLMVSGAYEETRKKVELLFEPALLSSLCVGVALLHLTKALFSLGGYYSLLSIPVVVWCTLTLSSSISYFRGIEFIPSLFFPFSFTMFYEAFYSLSYLDFPSEHFNTIGFFALGVFSLFVARWIDRSIKKEVKGGIKKAIL